MACGREAMKCIPAIAVVAAFSVGCSELVIPEEGPSNALEYRFPSEGEFVALTGGECDDFVCDVEEVDQETAKRYAFASLVESVRAASTSHAA